MARRQFGPTRSLQDCVVWSHPNPNVIILPDLTRTRVLFMAIASVAMSSSNYENPWEDHIGETSKAHLEKKDITELPTGHVTVFSLNVVSVVQSKMKPTLSMLKLVRRLCTARRCLRCWQVRQYVTVSAPSCSILTSQDTASAHACF